jgi:hypothetical protein
MEEYQAKPTFVTEWGSFSYMVIPFGLKNSSAMFSRIVVAAFKEFIHKFLEVYLDDSNVFMIQVEIGGHPHITLAQSTVFHFGIFSILFWVLNFYGHFEALNSIFRARKCLENRQRHSMG